MNAQPLAEKNRSQPALYSALRDFYPLFTDQAASLTYLTPYKSGTHLIPNEKRSRSGLQRYLGQHDKLSELYRWHLGHFQRSIIR